MFYNNCVAMLSGPNICILMLFTYLLAFATLTPGLLTLNCTSLDKGTSPQLSSQSFADNVLEQGNLVDHVPEGGKQTSEKNPTNH